ncbi:Phytanoyl-CoA dioxygenase [Penicillium daleae]|uniref:Phytanoyl-CoA dioxygenase n=1 Tax=Penicillium daleae TaxID=63821 RepID=A0AAD6CFQ3_9EURO|nr:Phytanoyl-CoA dioxygenase [Penicillium daleae]KAJ5462094.1 Phytanoyl-CoA dioxygenase [Penicillium daleae]
MDNFHYALAAEQLQSFQENGYLLVRGFFNPEETKVLQQWALEVHDLPQTPGVPWMPYEEVNGQGQRVLCRTENFANSHAGFDSFLRGQRATSVLQQLAGEEMLLFKEKINYKLAGSGGFDPHIDANAYTHVKNIKHLTILAAVDEMNAINGGLEVVNGSHRMEVPLGADRCIEPAWVDSHRWTPCDLHPGLGDILVFGSYLAHRSGANTSSKDRRAIYATYNCATEGDLHDEYYADRQKLWPATHMRKEGESYEEGRTRYAFGTPMLTVDGKPRPVATA